MRAGGRSGWLSDAALALAVLVGAWLRLAAAPAAPGTFDEVGFTLALARYDLLAFEPHFPGYPLAVLLARACHAAGAAAPYAVAAAALQALAAVALHVALRRGWPGALAGGLLALAPVAVIESSRATSDGIAAGLLALGLCGALAGRALPAGLLLGAAAAAKPDLALFLSALLAVPRPARPRAALAAGAPLALAVVGAAAGVDGPAALALEGTRFLGGHLTDWGGGVATTAALPRPRLALAAAPLLGGLGGRSSLDLLLAGGVLAALAARAPRALRRAVLVAGLPYALWLLLGQNLANPRHTLPLLPLLALLAGGGLGRFRPALAAGLALAALLGAGSGAARAVAREAARGRPADALAATVAPGTRLYAGAEARAVAWRLPGADVRRARSVDHVRKDLLADPCPPVEVRVASTVAGADALPLVARLERVDLHLLGPGGAP
ncbi:MAG: hypothetical protein M9894_30390 [Planctomycetes bacterium]|nr:hypothetical protein [Planctomycetota bacterium]